VTKHDRPVKVLVVDDNLEFLAAASEWLEIQPATRLAGTARDGAEAIAAVARLAPDLVLMEAFMPVRDGFEATRMLKAGAGAPIVIVLGISEGVAMEDEARAAGADGFLAKSEFAARLPGLIRDLMGRET
jgi:CheY-like chemotaxis protein